ncbi:MAG: polyphosphate kinase 1 [Myxococcota bacterium]|nr:polyphosphate kinase 1 [Myxococcota bacterium]
MNELPERTPRDHSIDSLGRRHRVPDLQGGAGTGDGNDEQAQQAQLDAPLASIPKGLLFINRELSWLAFNRRVLEEAQDPENPLLERVKFLAIASTNLDEFFEIRVAGVMEMVDAEIQAESHDGLTPPDELEEVRRDAHAFSAAMHQIWSQGILPELVKADIRFPSIEQLTGNQKTFVDDYFQREVYPILTPLAVDPAHPFPVLLNKSLNLAVLLQETNKNKRRTHRMAVVQVPRALPRIVSLPEQDGHRGYVFTADVVRANLQELFPGLVVAHASTFRVTRDGNLELDEMQATDLMSSIEKELIKRRRGEPVRLEIDSDAHPEILERFLRAFQLEGDDIFFCDGPVNLGRIMELYSLIEKPELKDAPAKPRRQRRWGSSEDMFADLRESDILLHHPYDSFSNVEDFLTLAARDPKVVAIKQTIYRAGSKNVMVEALIEAAQQRKQVTAIVELKARFDEAANIQWARRMERAGVHVVYGIVGMKTHAKCTLIVRREDDNSLRRYCHIATGNYNAATARLYTDLGVMTARDDLGEEVAETFNMITGHTRVPEMEHLLVSPFTMQKEVIASIHREISNHQAGRPSGVQAKLNNLSDPKVILALYEASRAGVKVELSVRSVCCLRPGVKGFSENITVTTIVDRFLEHSRVYCFENAGDPKVYISSADWMVRNLERRVEVAAPILSPALKKRVIDEVLGMALKDNVKARRIRSDGQSERIERKVDELPLRSQTALLDAAKRTLDEDDAKAARRRTRNREAPR